MRRSVTQLAFALIMLCLVATPSAQAGDSPFIGEVSLFAGSFAPAGWHFCDGALLPIAQHSALFAILGARFGGDGKTTFALPDYRTAEAALRQAGTDPSLGARYIIALQGIFPPRGD